MVLFTGGFGRFYRFGRQHAPKRPPLQFRWLLKYRHIGTGGDDVVDHLGAKLLMGILAPAVLKGDLDLVAVRDELVDLADLVVQVVAIPPGWNLISLVWTSFWFLRASLRLILSS